MSLFTTTINFDATALISIKLENANLKLALERILGNLYTYKVVDKVCDYLTNPTCRATSPHYHYR